MSFVRKHKNDEDPFYTDLDCLEKEIFGSNSPHSHSPTQNMVFPDQKSSEVPYPGSRSPTMYESPQLSRRSATIYGSTKSGTTYGSPDSSSRSSTCNVSSNRGDSIQTICENIDMSEDDNLSSSVINDISQKLKSRQDFTLSLPSFADYKKPMVVGKKVTPRDVVVFRNAIKSYGSGKNRKEVLKGMNMTIKEGSIYGLLGASGCGKTTLLSILVGLKNLDKKKGGDLFVFGGKPGDPRVGIPGKRVGYMPQELALYGEFSISETFRYFGRLYGMDSSTVELKSKFLLNLLDLPMVSSRLIRNLSGGQQRRISFAVSLIHNPELLILDEPTVGVDPMLRQSIWNYLKTLSTDIQKTTIIITTHYIEEARQASAVGLMRHGRLLAQACPTSLLEKYNLGSLEEVFLKLCIKDELGETDEPDDEKSEVTTLPGDYSACFDLNYETSYTSPFAATLPRVAKMGKKTSPRYRNVVYPGVTAGSMDDLSIQGISYIKYPVEKMPSKKLNFEEARNIRLSRAIEQQKKEDELLKEVADSWMTGSPEMGCWKRSGLASCFSSNRLWALMVKNLIKMCRNPVMLLFIFALPAVQVVFFCVAIGRDVSGLKIAFVNEEVLSNVNKTPSFSGVLNDSFFETSCPYKRECEFENLSCRYLRHLTNDTEGRIVVSSFDTFEEAYDSVKEGLFWAVVTVPYNFSVGVLDRSYNGMDTTPVALNQSTIRIDMDSSNQQINFVIRKTLLDTYTNFVGDLLHDCDYDERLAKPPLHYGSPIYGRSEPNFTEFMAPGIVLLIVFFLAVALTGEAFIIEKKDGLLDRSQIAGVSGYEIMVAQLLTQCIVLVGQTASTLIFVLLVFSVPCNGPVIWVIVLTFLQGITGMSFGFLISILCSVETTAMQVSIGSFYPNLLLSGILWPIEGMPKHLQSIAWYLPCTCACQAMRDIMSRGWGVTGHLSVQLGLISSATWIVIFLSASLICLRFQQRTA